MKTVKLTNILLIILASCFVFSIYYLYLNILKNREINLESKAKIELFLSNQTKNRNGIERNYKLLQRIDKELVK